MRPAGHSPNARRGGNCGEDVGIETPVDTVGTRGQNVTPKQVIGGRPIEGEFARHWVNCTDDNFDNKLGYA